MLSRTQNVPFEKSITNHFPNVALEWHPTKNGDRIPNKTAYGSNQRAWWKCQKCGREWETCISNRTIGGQKCASCARKKNYDKC